MVGIGGVDLQRDIDGSHCPPPTLQELVQEKAEPRRWAFVWTMTSFAFNCLLRQLDLNMEQQTDSQ